jgi:hypothetical protein
VAAPPPGAIVVPAAPVPVAAPSAVPAAPAPEARSFSYTPPVEPYTPPTWRPSPTEPQQDSRLSPQRQPDSSTQPPLAGQNSDTRAGTPPLPASIPDFRIIKKGVASGLRPTHLEGLDWLKTNGYRMAVYIRAPGEPDDADRKLFEDKHGMKFASLAIAPDALTLEVVDQFNHMVADPANRPLFVYDKDGSLAGALWYLHFRMIDQQGDEEARAIAARLGLKEEHREMWIAIQKVLSGRR